MPDTHHSLATLSFAGGARDSGKICLWAGPLSSDAAECNAEGRARADELLVYMDREGLPFLFGHVVSAIIAGGRYGPLEVGFFHRIADFALAGEIPLLRPETRPRPLLTLVEG